ncbi:MAG: PilZ domain-containing protein [Deltaproteobacteria bacterium]|jgi:hypothetical protein
MSNPKDANYRNHPRAAVRWAAYWTDGLRARTGEIRDISKGGLFLSPAWRPSTTYSPGDEIEIRCAIEDLSIDLKAVVRWSGTSEQHACEGFGLEVPATADLERLLEAAEKN